MKNKKLTLDLPAPPSDWNALSYEQLKEIYRITKRTDDMRACKMETFLMLNGLKAVRGGFHIRPNDGEVSYHFRRKGVWGRVGGRVCAMAAWEVCYWIDRYLKFMDDPMKLLVLPFEFLRVGCTRCKAPDPQMVNLTYEQYGNAQRYLVGYWDMQKQLTEVENLSLRELRKMEQEMRRQRAGFLAHLFTPSSLSLLDQRHQSTRLSLRRVYHYDAERAERMISRFLRMDRRDETLFNICAQFFQSCQLRYKEDFPFLFKEYSGGADRSMLAMEIDTINAVQKYAGYCSQQEVYDSNSVFILGFLNSMSHEAKQIEDMNNKMKKIK